MSNPNAHASRNAAGEVEIHVLGQSNYLIESEAFSLYADLMEIFQPVNPRYDVTVETTESFDDHEGIRNYSISKDFIDLFGPAGHTTYNTAHVVRVTVTEGD